jgi:hypothetical protein
LSSILLWIAGILSFTSEEWLSSLYNELIKDGTFIAGGYDPKLESENADFDNDERAVGATIGAGYVPRLESENADWVGNLFKLIWLAAPTLDCYWSTISASSGPARFSAMKREEGLKICYWIRASSV